MGCVWFRRRRIEIGSNDGIESPHRANQAVQSRARRTAPEIEISGDAGGRLRLFSRLLPTVLRGLAKENGAERRAAGVELRRSASGKFWQLQGRQSAGLFRHQRF